MIEYDFYDFLFCHSELVSESPENNEMLKQVQHDRIKNHSNQINHMKITVQTRAVN